MLESKFLYLLLYDYQKRGIFDHLTYRLSRYITFETIAWTNGNSKAGFDPTLDCYNSKIIRIVISRYFF